MIVPSSRPSRCCRSISSESPTAASGTTEEDVDADEEEEEEEDGEEVDPQAEVRYLDPDADPDSIREWELDFCSRPILDARGKKVWELVVCDATLSLQFTRYFPNTSINSVTLRDALASVADDLGVPLPDPRPLLPGPDADHHHPRLRRAGRQGRPQPPLRLAAAVAGGALPFSSVREEVESLGRRYAFGAGLDLDLLGFELDDTTLVPGVAVESSRAKPLAAWMNGLEICALEVDTGRAILILAAGVSTRYVYAGYQKSPAATQEAEAWEAAKKACGGLHFLAVQENLNSDGCVGFWLLLDLPQPPV
ncbi:hypothetical protein PR202_gb09041 [Eleusine coracana subsp. coracana]|uniref:PI-PLC Y-box domain-containing protein n=1 Tax=Eleusine coracana subsp. coracana TaxID=191504 RepID=A0AAV5EH96_ELECO|nr:hypothetical protein PR202_gb09041 [Eleusine coracana subsp. coracana]